EEEGFVGKGGFGGEEDNIEDIVVVANNLCSSMIQTILSVDFKENINTKSYYLMSFGKKLFSRFTKRGNKPDPRDVKIASLKQRIQELEFLQLQQTRRQKRQKLSPTSGMMGQITSILLVEETLGFMITLC
nr:hypothetical protein [Tanacetum cinerariifolium]